MLDLTVYQWIILQSSAIGLHRFPLHSDAILCAGGSFNTLNYIAVQWISMDSSVNRRNPVVHPGRRTTDFFMK
jgi:hypothetical protein